MNTLKIVGYLFGGILIFFGVLFLWAGVGVNTGWVMVGLVMMGLGFALILILAIFLKTPSKDITQYTTNLQVDLPADVNIERFKCADCGAQLTMDEVKMVAGAPMVNCPYCGAAYQLTEDPKW